MWLKLRERINASAFLICVLVGFATCSYAGHKCAQHNPFINFRRFHRLLNAETYFYPTVSQMVALAKESLDKGEKVVIVGGNSIAMGKGQGKDLWTENLQRRLGPDYKVLNFAQSLMPPLSGPYLAFLSLTQKYNFVFYVAVAEYCSVNDVEEPYQGYPYWWDAYYKKLLPPVPSIENWISERALLTRDKQASDECKLGAYLDSLFYFRDLWTTVGYKYFFTVWTPGTAANFWEPRQLVPDYDPPVLPIAARFYNFNPEIDKPRLKARFNWIYQETAPEQWQLSEDNLFMLKNAMSAQIPTEVRPKMLIIGVRDCPYYVRQDLTQKEQQQLIRTAKQSTKLWRDFGCRAIEAGGDYVDEDFIDDCHLSATGGVKLAKSVAEELSKMEDACR